MAASPHSKRTALPRCSKNMPGRLMQNAPTRQDRWGREGGLGPQLRRVMRQKKVNVAVGYVLSRAAASRPAPLTLARAAGAA